MFYWFSFCGVGGQACEKAVGMSKENTEKFRNYLKNIGNRLEIHLTFNCRRTRHQVFGPFASHSLVHSLSNHLNSNHAVAKTFSMISSPVSVFLFKMIFLLTD